MLLEPPSLQYFGEVGNRSVIETRLALFYEQMKVPRRDPVEAAHMSVAMDRPQGKHILSGTDAKMDALSALPKPRRALLWSELPDDEMAALEKAADAYLEEPPE